MRSRSSTPSSRMLFGCWEGFLVSSPAWSVANCIWGRSPARTLLGTRRRKRCGPNPVREDRSLHGQVISALGPRFVADVESDPSVPPEEVVVARARGYRSIVAVPLVRDARAVGSMAVTRRAAGPFTDSEIALLRTFADQAVIAIENVRLFTELQGKNRALTQAHAQVSESLEQQTAT